MNNKKGKNSQLSLSQSLLRRKTRKLASTIDKTTLDETEGNASSEENSFERNTITTTSFSQPENNDFDDSFDLFLPKKSPKKFPPPKAPSSQSSFFEVRNSKKSRYFDESGQLQVPKVIKDDDLELAIAVSLQESKGSAVNLKPVKTVSAPAPRGKLKKACSHSLLMRRSAADRERIITEKVAIVLMNTNKIPAASQPESRQPCLLYSAFLNERFNTLNTLWSLSQADLTKIELARFCTTMMLSYVDAPFHDRAATHLDASHLEEEKKEVSGELHLAVSDEDIFGSSSDESVKGPSPKRPRSDEGSPSLCEVNARSDRVNEELRSGSPAVETSSQPPADVTNIGSQSPVSATNITNRPSPVTGTNARCEGQQRSSNASGDLCLEVGACDLLTTETNIDECIRSDAKTPVEEVRPLKAIDRNSSARRSISSSFVENFDLTKHHRKLSRDLISLSKSGVSSMIEIRKGPDTLYAHGCIFKARCPILFDALLNNSGCLDEFSYEVCQAVFEYVYAGDIRKALALKLDEKNQLAELTLRFGLEELAEELFPKNGVSSFTETDVFLEKATSDAGRFSANVPKHVLETENPLPTSVPRPEKVHDVIVLDSDCCSAEEVLSEVPDGNATDDELDKYLKDGVRLLANSTPRGRTAVEQLDNEKGSPSEIISREPKRSIDRYFRDSFPSLDGISVTPRPSLCVEAKGPTPCSSKGIRNCETPGGQLVVSELATPMPNFESMVTPDLKEALQKYGIKKGIGRRKAVTLLRYIYDQIHPPSDHPAVARAIGDIKSKAKPVPSAPDSDSDVHTLSSDSSCDEEMFEDMGDVFHSQAEPDSQETSSKPGLLREVGRYIKSNILLYAAVLKYEPIWLNKFHQHLKENGIKCNKKELIEVLDELGITFRTEQTEKQLEGRRNKKPTRRKR